MHSLCSPFLRTASQAVRSLIAVNNPLRHRAFFAFLVITLFIPWRAWALPNLITHSFSVTDSNTLPGTSAAPGAPCNGTIAAADQIDNLALVGLFYQNDCYTDGRYNNNNYPVAHGKRIFHRRSPGPSTRIRFIRR